MGAIVLDPRDDTILDQIKDLTGGKGVDGQTGQDFVLGDGTRLFAQTSSDQGHPVTTGLDTMDYFVSSRLIEPAGAQSHYSERLMLLDTMPFYYYRPELPTALPGWLLGPSGETGA